MYLYSYEIFLFFIIEIFLNTKIFYNASISKYILFLYLHKNIILYIIIYRRQYKRNTMIYAFVQLFDKTVIKIMESTPQDTKKTHLPIS